MQGKLFIAIILSASVGDAAVAGESLRRQGCPRAEQTQQKQHQLKSQQPQQQQRRVRPQDCPAAPAIPSVVDPTPFFIL